ncbi:MAG: SpoIIIAC/SpoIIIAD family protein [Acutalibacteraceae bacterium]|jgi:stage III sporulation protein AD
MNIAVLAVAGIASALAAQLIRKTNPEISSVLTIGTGVLIAAAVVAQILPVTTQIQIFLDRADVSTEYAGVLLKSLGVCFLVQFAADACRDAGESSLAGKIEFAGRVSVAVLALPLFRAVIDLAVSLIG